MKTSASLLQTLRSNNSGGVMIFVALAIVLLIIAGGVAIDTSRSQTLQSGMQSALDSAGFAAARLAMKQLSDSEGGELNEQEVQQTAQKFFTANLPAGFIAAAPITVTTTINAERSKLDLTATTIQPTTLMAIVGKPDVTVSARSEIRIANGTLPINGICNNTSAGQCNSPNGAINIVVTGSTTTWICPGSNGGVNSLACSYTIPLIPINGLCNNSGPNSCFTPDEAINKVQTGLLYTWICPGRNGGVNSAPCNYSLPTTPIDGQCNNMVANGCATAASAINSITTGGTTTWTCPGLNGGGNSVPCSIVSTPVDGLCDNSGPNRCFTGAVTSSNVLGSLTTWVCSGLDGGSDDACSYNAVTPLNGQCSPSGPNACLVGSVTPLSVTAGVTTWRCEGLSGGNFALCSYQNPTNGVCNSSLGSCISGTPVNVLASSWVCQGQFGGTNASCSLSNPPVNGVCGAGLGACSSGTQSNVSAATGTWTCAGIDGGLSSSCSIPMSINGVCGSLLGQCVSGTSANVSVPNWDCQGQGGGTSANCSLAPINGACGASHGNCVAGTPSIISAVDWTCQGQYGGSSSGSCSSCTAVNGSCAVSLGVCSSGSPIGLIGNNWTCAGECGGTNASCNYDPPVNGVCATTYGVCSSGSAQITGALTWNCNGAFGGSSDSCSISAPVNGVCSTTIGSCTSGVAGPTSIAAGSTVWICQGSNGGTDDSCNSLNPVNGACGFLPGTCDAGNPINQSTTNNSLADNVWSSKDWQCSGENGGSTASCNSTVSCSGGSYCSCSTGNITGSSVTDNGDGTKSGSFTCAHGNDLSFNVSCSFSNVFGSSGCP